MLLATKSTLAGRSARTVMLLAAGLILAGCSDTTRERAKSATAEAGSDVLRRPRIAVELPDEHNTPDGMTLDRQNNIILSCPNFNNPKYPAWMMKITPDDKLEEFFKLPLHPETRRACPLGVDLASDGNLYIADSQALGGFEDYQSRLLRLTMKEGRPVDCAAVVNGFVFSNGVACFGDSVYVTETKFEPKPEKGPMPSGVYRFKLSELDSQHPIELQRRGKDPHLVCRLTTRNELWKVGANGIAFARDGTMYVSNFGDAQVIAVTLDNSGNVISQKVVAQGPPLKSVDGLKVDATTGLIYLADFLGNAVHRVDPRTGKVTVITQNANTTGEGGLLDKPSEVCLRDGKLYVSNIDLNNMDGNTFDKPYTISVIELKGK